MKASLPLKLPALHLLSVSSGRRGVWARGLGQPHSPSEPQWCGALAVLLSRGKGKEIRPAHDTSVPSSTDSTTLPHNLTHTHKRKNYSNHYSTPTSVSSCRFIPLHCLRSKAKKEMLKITGGESHGCCNPIGERGERKMGLVPHRGSWWRHMRASPGNGGFLLEKLIILVIFLPAARLTVPVSSDRAPRLGLPVNTHTCTQV